MYKVNNMVQTMILAIGNAGGNIVEAIRKDNKQDELNKARYVFADGDANDLSKHNAAECSIVHLEAESKSFPTDIFTDIGKLVIVSGLGGKTATIFTELAAIAAKDAGVDSVNVVATLPFIFEGENRVKLATSAAQRLTEIGGVNVTVFNNEDLLAKYPDLNFFNAFEAADKEILQIIEQNWL